MTSDEIIQDIESKLTITYIGHSLGGMTLPMYVVQQKTRKQPHYLTSAILLSPAGILKHSPHLVAYSFGWFFKHIVSKITDHIALPNMIIEAG